MAQITKHTALHTAPVKVAISNAPSRTRSITPWLRSDRAKIGGSIFLFVAAAAVLFWTFSSGTDVGDASKNRLAIDAQSGKTFTVRIIDGERFPWKNPDTGESTLYPVEKCYWTKDGKAKLDPTFVFVKLYAGVNEKTTCPDCGREVRQHNPLPPDDLLAEAAEQKSTGK